MIQLQTKDTPLIGITIIQVLQVMPYWSDPIFSFGILQSTMIYDQWSRIRLSLVELNE